MDRGCTVPGLAAMLRAQTLSTGQMEAAEGRHEESRALRELQEEKFRLHDYWMKAGLGQMVGLSTVREAGHRGETGHLWGWLAGKLVNIRHPLLTSPRYSVTSVPSRA